MKAFIRQKAALTRNALETDPGFFGLRELPEAFLVRTRVGPLSSDRSYAVAAAEHIRFCDAHGVLSPYAIGSVIPRSAIERGEFSGYSHYYTQVDTPPEGIPVFTREAGRYLVACHTGGYDTVRETYQKLLGYAREKGLPLSGCFFEDILLDELSVKGEENYVLHISIRADG